MGLDGVSGLLNDGKLKAYWERGSTWQTLDNDYAVMRDLGERKLKTRALGTERDPHPVSGALMSENGFDELHGPTGDHYGSVFVVLKNERVADRTMFTLGDSVEVGFDRPGNVMDFESAKRVKAVKETTAVDYPYVEALVQGGVRLEDIESINIDLSKMSSLGGYTYRGHNREILMDIVDQVEKAAKAKGIKVNVLKPPA